MGATDSALNLIRQHTEELSPIFFYYTMLRGKVKHFPQLDFVYAILNFREALISSALHDEIYTALLCNGKVLL